MSLLGHLVPGWLPENAAAGALAYLLDRHASPGMAETFIDFLGRAGVPAFPLGGVEHDPSQADDGPPYLTSATRTGSRGSSSRRRSGRGCEGGSPLRI